MIYTELTKKAMNLAFKKHLNQIDKSGLPYIFHPVHIAEQMDDEDSVIVALLHDVMEDTQTDINELRTYGFSETVIDALVLLTHNKKINYETYIQNISQNPLATKVKIVDLQHNSDLSRLNIITSKDIARVQKYVESLNYLKEFTHSEISIK